MNNPLSKSILITSESDTFLPLERYCKERGHLLSRKSLIEVVPQKGINIPLTDWIFFSSPKGADAYLKLYPIRAKKVGVYGKATALKVLAFERRPIEFSGKEGQSPQEIGQSFLPFLAEGETVLFPIGQRSKKSIISQLPASSYQTVQAYETVLKPIIFDVVYDIILFTSPSNYLSFIKHNSINADTLCLAIGKTTETAIIQHNPKQKVTSLKKPDLAGLKEIIQPLIER